MVPRTSSNGLSVVDPVPDDPVEALRGSLAHLRRPDLTAAEAIQAARDEVVDTSERKWPTPKD